MSEIGNQRDFDTICQNMTQAQREAMADFFLGSEDRNATAALVEASVRAAILSGVRSEDFAALVQSVWNDYAAHMNKGTH